ncbi:hypothetical protein ACIQ6K_01700 [Streptomyces sp. NPDC096354]|uniref:hypothetical protein n=1 Tax=Streptomyces sp. NPDC096354 TaxID=3366088 RepID=UPI003812BED3
MDRLHEAQTVGLSSMLVAGGSAEAADTRQRFGFGRNGPKQLSHRGHRGSGAWQAL